VSPVILAPAELALVDFDSLIRTAYLLRAALHVIQHNLSAELGTVRDGMCSEIILLLDTEGRNAAHDVVSEEKNLHEI
jgi:hypothetical protein